MNLKPFYLFFAFALLLSCSTKEQEFNHQTIIPALFGRERSVTIHGVTFDAMEPFISPNGETLFFNNLNDGINTKIYFAERVNDSVFTFVGELQGANQSAPPHLDAVPDLDMNGNFYWTSTRNYPAELDNLFRGMLEKDSVINIGRVRGDFYKEIPGWIVIDHGISLDGQMLYYNNARFDNQTCQGPCETELGVARKSNDSTFIRLPESPSILQNVTDPLYIYYAPCISSDDLELYFTRYLKGPISEETQVEICVATREDATLPFTTPKALFSSTISEIVEAPSLSADRKLLYYHKKIGEVHQIMMRYRIEN